MALVTPTVQAEGVTGAWSWAVAWSAAPGEVACGDRHLVMQSGDGTVLAVVDALGHGQEAAAVASRAVAAVGAAPPGLDAEALTRACHAALDGTRGAVMTLAVHTPHAGSLDMIGVGNVEAWLRHDEVVDHVFNAPGIVGYRLPPLRARRMVTAAGDLLVMASDGVAQGFSATVRVSGRSVAATARQVLETHRRGDDDALVLVARLDGDGG